MPDIKTQQESLSSPSEDEKNAPPEFSVTDTNGHDHGSTRREFLAGATATGVGLAFGSSLLSDSAPAHAQLPSTPPVGTVDVALNINGIDTTLTIEPRVTLLDALRERLHLTGTKKGCDHGQCGACTVHIDGWRMNSCLTLAIMHQGQRITTIEGLAQGNRLHPMQSAFIVHDGFQCGYCTPGQIMSAVGLVAEGHAHTEDEIREQMSGNLCRCGAYPNIVNAVRDALAQSTRGGS